MNRDIHVDCVRAALAEYVYWRDQGDREYGPDEQPQMDAIQIGAMGAAANINVVLMGLPATHLDKVSTATVQQLDQKIRAAEAMFKALRAALSRITYIGMPSEPQWATPEGKMVPDWRATIAQINAAIALAAPPCRHGLPDGINCMVCDTDGAVEATAPEAHAEAVARDKAEGLDRCEKTVDLDIRRIGRQQCILRAGHVDGHAFARPEYAPGIPRCPSLITYGTQCCLESGHEGEHLA